MSSKVTERADATSVLRQRYAGGILFVVSSPSGGGKGTLIQRVLDIVPNLSYSVSYTTRAPRNGEVDGREYFFVNARRLKRWLPPASFSNGPVCMATLRHSEATGCS